MNASENEIIAYVRAIGIIPQKLGLKTGYRLIVNSGKDGCQCVEHLHTHIIGGTQLRSNII